MKGPVTDFSAFLPKSCRPLLAGPEGSATGFRRVEGSVLFCDVAGFTPLTEALMVMGREGSEELTRLLNDYFTCMVAIVEEEGGDVLRFGGDAMTVLFPGRSRAGAAGAAARMMAAMDRFADMPTGAGTFSLSMKVGAAWGAATLGLLPAGDDSGDFYAAGTPLDDAAEAEHHAVPGQIVCHPSFLAGAPASLKGKRAGEGGFAFLGRVSEEDVRPYAYEAEPPAHLLCRGVPAYLQEEGGRGSSGEHRGVAVLFLALKGLTDAAGPEDLHQRLTQAFGVLTDTARRYRGTLNKIDLGDKGAKALLLFGAPYALEDREEMALRAAVELVQGERWPAGVTPAAGITSSQLFTGPVGSRTRREYTAMGDGINLAARLMQRAASGQVLCEAGCARAAKGLRFKVHAAITVKGKQAPVEIAEPQGEAEHETGSTAVLVEREALCARLIGLVEDGGGRAVLLQGAAGVGKSALIGWLGTEAADAGLAVHRLGLGPFSRERPFAAWRGPLRALVGVGRGDTAEVLREARDRAFTEEPEGYRALINPLLDLPEEPNPAVKNLSAKERKDLLFAMLARAFRKGAPRLVLCDNLHHADPQSLELLGFLLTDAEGAPWRFVGAVRTDLAPPNVPQAVEVMAVEALSRAGVEEVLRRVHGFSEVPKEVLDWFMGRSAGNPTLVNALLAAVESAGLVVRDAYGLRLDQDRLFRTAFPDTLEGLYLARVDGLAAEAREVLQFASILGVSVSVNLLREVCRRTPAALQESLRALQEEGLLVADTWGERAYVRFTEALLREAVYHALPFAFKRAGHLALARLLDVDGENNQQIWATLANHYEHGGDEARARVFHRLAGRDAFARYDNVTALAHLEFVCKDLTPDPEDVEDAFSLMDALGFLGKWEEARPWLAKLEAFANDMKLAHQARLQNFVSQDLASKQDWKGTEAALKKGIRLAKKAGDVVLQGKAYVNLVGRVYGPTGKFDEAEVVLQRALRLPSGSGQTGFRTLARMNLGAVAKHQGSYAKSQKHLEEAYKASVCWKLELHKGIISGNLAALMFDRGLFLESLKWGQRAADVLKTFAARSALLNVLQIMAVSHISLGEIEKAKALLLRIGRESVAKGHRQAQALSQQGLAQVALLEGRMSDYFASADAALQMLGRNENPRDYGFTLFSLFLALRSLSARKQARSLADQYDLPGFVKEAPIEEPLRNSLQDATEWIAKRPMAARSILAEDACGRALQKVEDLTQKGRRAQAHRALQGLERLATTPESKMVLLRYRLVLCPESRRNDLTRSRDILRRCHGGIAGARLACQLALVGQGNSRNRWLEDARGRLEVLRMCSPDWAWESIRSFPEVREVLEGEHSH